MWCPGCSFFILWWVLENNSLSWILQSVITWNSMHLSVDWVICTFLRFASLWRTAINPSSTRELLCLRKLPLCKPSAFSSLLRCAFLLSCEKHPLYFLMLLVLVSPKLFIPALPLPFVHSLNSHCPHFNVVRLRFQHSGSLVCWY